MPKKPSDLIASKGEIYELEKVNDTIFELREIKELLRQILEVLGR